jgi:hypothetical protein
MDEYTATLGASLQGVGLGAAFIKKYSSYRTNQKHPPRVFSICVFPFLTYEVL